MKLGFLVLSASGALLQRVRKTKKHSRRHDGWGLFVMRLKNLNNGSPKGIQSWALNDKMT